MNELSISAYVSLALRTEKPLNAFERLVHGCMGLITEIGEVTTELKRMAIYEKPLDDSRKAHILEELGDVMWYCAIILDALDANLQYLQSAPRMDPPDHFSGAWEATALVLGDHCGRICRNIQALGAHQIQEEDLHESLQNTAASVGLIFNCCHILAKICGSTIEAAMYDNIMKLRVRYPEKYSNEEAEVRADKAGADARVS